MRNINFTDWQDLWLKKDIEGISKKINQFPKVDVVVIVEIVIGIATLAFGIISFNNVFFSIETIKIIIIILLCLSIVIPISIYLIDFFIKREKTSSDIKRKKLDVKSYVDIFDNKICNCVMMANTLCENISIENNENEIEAQNYYYVSETSYYINKCLDEFNHMQSMSEEIFIVSDNVASKNKKVEPKKLLKCKKANDNKTSDNKKVAPQRLLLLLKLIIEIRITIISKIKKLKDSDGQEIIKYILLENDKHDDYLLKFIYHVHNKVDENLGFNKLAEKLETVREDSAVICKNSKEC